MAKKKRTAAPAAEPAQETTQPEGKRHLPDIRSVGAVLWSWILGKRWYIISFCLPVILLYIAYAIFGLYPFGEKSVLALDLNAQYVYYFEALRDALHGDGSIFYNWSRNLSGGFMGIIGYYLASPFTLIVMLLPERMLLTSLLLMILAKVGAAGVTFSLYLQKSKGLEPLHATLFSLLYALMAYMVIQTIDPMWLDGLVMLPLIVRGVERLVDEGRKLDFIIPAAIMFIANFYIGYMIGIFSALYFLYYLLLGTDKRFGEPMNYVWIFGRFVAASITAVMLAAIMVLPVVYALSLGKFQFSKPDYSFKLQFDPLDVFGQLLTCQYDSVNVQGSPELYCGILTLVLLPLFFLSERIGLRRKIGYGLLLIVMYFSMYIKPVDMLWHGGQVPNWLPFRYSFIISFLLLSMAAMAFRELGSIRRRWLGGIFFGMTAVILFLSTQDYAHLDIMKSIWLSIGLSGVYLLLLYGQLEKRTAVLFPVLLLCASSCELVFNSVETMKSVDKEVIYSSVPSYRTFMQSGRAATRTMERYDATHGDHKFYHAEKTFSRTVNDNIAFGLKGLTHSSSVMNDKILDFIQALGYNGRSYYSRYDGTTELADSLLGIRYVLDRGDTYQRTLLHPGYVRVADYSYEDRDDKDENGNPKSKTISVYENPDALAPAYMVDAQILRVDHLGNDNPFNSQNVFMSSMIGQVDFGEGATINGGLPFYRRITLDDTVLGDVTESDYNEQKRYTATGSGDPTIDYSFTADSRERVYAFLKTHNEQKANLWLGVWDDEKGKFDYKGFGTYFETRNYCILDLGSYEPGTRVSLRVTVDNDDGSVIIKEPLFYYFDEALFHEKLEALKGQQMEITKFRDTSLSGTVTASENQVLFTTIPAEPGWTVKVDGKVVEPKTALKATLCVELTPGTHTVSFSYFPPGLLPGMILFAAGIAMCVVFYRHDKKHGRIGSAPQAA